MASDAMKKKLEKAKQSAANARKRAAEGRSKWRRKGFIGAGGFAIGAAERNGMLDRLPTPFGAPKILTMGVLATFAGEHLSGGLGDFADGVSDACIGVAGYQAGSRGSVSGGPVFLGAPGRGVIAPGAPSVAGQLAADDDELADLEEQVAGLEYDADLMGVDGDDDDFDDA